jgi:hypothetical protein
MSIRAAIHFIEGPDKSPEAIIFRHGEGDPRRLGKDLISFLGFVEGNVPDTRFDDASLLAARWVVYDAILRGNPPKGRLKDFPIGFTHVRILANATDDIHFIFTVHCYGNSVLPKITWTETCEDPETGIL